MFQAWKIFGHSRGAKKLGDSIEVLRISDNATL
jgi:hypothetical protein